MSDASDRESSIALSSSMGAGIGGVLLYGKAKETKTFQNLATSLGETKLGKGFTSASESVSQMTGKVTKSLDNISEGIGKKITQSLVSKFGEQTGKSLSKAGEKLAGEAFGVGIDAVMGSMNIASRAQAPDVPDDIKGYNVSMEVVSTATNVALNFLSGPAALVMVLAQVVGSIIDSAWNPFEAHFNSDLETMRKSMNEALKKAYNEQNVNWPLEVKPDFLSGLNSQSPNYSETIKEFRGYMDEYYANNGIITKEAALEEENMLVEIINMRRMRRAGKFDENGNLVIADPTATAVSILDNDNNNMLMLLALAIAVKKRNAKMAPKPSRVVQYWQANKLSVIISSISFVIIFFCCISIVFTTTAAVSQ